MPPLRECREDIETIARRILQRLSSETRELGVQVELADDAVDALCNYSFPGNVRELENILERALALTNDPVIHADDLGLVPTSNNDIAGDLTTGSLQDHLDQVERAVISDALQRAGGNRTAAARILGITFRSMRYRMARLGIAD